jgi:hypothetical protein
MSDLLNQKSPPDWLKDIHGFIQEEKYKCLHKLRKIKEMEMEATFLGNLF